MAGLPPALPLDTPPSQAFAAVTATFGILAILTTIARFYGKHLKRQSTGLDDWVLVCALCLIIGRGIITAIAISHGGVGHHVADLTKANTTLALKLLAITQFLFPISIGLAKVSICLLLTQIFAVRSFKVWGRFVTGYCVFWIVMTCLICLLLCQPFAFNWDKEIPGGHCGDLVSAYVAIAALDILGDLMIVALPMRYVWSLQLPSRTKIELSVLFSLGFAEIIISILRIVIILKTPFAPPADYTYDSVPAYVFSEIEPSIGVIIASIPLIRPVFVKFSPWAPSSSQQYGSSSIYMQYARGGTVKKTADMGPRWSVQPGRDHYSRMEDGQHSLDNVNGSAESNVIRIEHEIEVNVEEPGRDSKGIHAL